MLFIRSSGKKSDDLTAQVIESLEDYSYNLLGEIDRYCKSRGIKVLYLNLYFDEDIFFSWTMEDFASVNKSYYVKVLSEKKRDAEFHRKYDNVHPGPNNVKIIAEKLTKYILEKKLVESKTGKH